MSRFRLQTALNVREKLKKLYQKSMAEQVQEAQKLKEQLQILQEAEQDNEESIDHAKSQGFTIHDLHIATRFRYRIQYHQNLVKEQLSEQEQVVERKRRELVHATQHKRALEILKEKYEQQLEQEQRKQEQMEMDEIALNLRRFSEHGYS